MERTTINTSGAPSRTIGIETHAHEREQILQIFLEQQARGVEIRPPRIVFYFRRDYRKGNQRHIGKLMRELGHGAWYVPVRGHHDQRVEIVLARPPLGLERIAEGIERGTVEIDAAGEELGIERRAPRHQSARD